MQLTFSQSLAGILLVLSIGTKASDLPPLPEPVTNNAVALVEVEQQQHLISFMGLGSGRTHKDVHNKVWSLPLTMKGQWQERKRVPSSLVLKGRLASIAASIGDKTFLFGGYTVAEDHSEVSSPDNFVYDLKTDTYKGIAPTPVPTDDAIALTYIGRYIYLISGWHNDGNVNLVQVYDVQTNTWRQASPFPGTPVFGHAGGIMDNRMVICDGVKVQARLKQRRTFKQVSKCFIGEIDVKNPLKVDWQLLEHPTRKGKYRMAAAGVELPNGKGVMFVGGSDNPYNYNGVGYDGTPSQPSADVWFYDIKQQKWLYGQHAVNTMDHRGLLISKGGEKAYILGGMGEQQKVLNSVTVLDLKALKLGSHQP